VARDSSDYTGKFASVMAEDHVPGRTLPLLYVLVLLTTLSRWVFVSVRGWTVSWFFVARLPMLTQGNRGLVKVLDGWRQNFLWALLMLAGLHVTPRSYIFSIRDGRYAADATSSHCH
jgi:hypothetical protein